MQVMEVNTDMLQVKITEGLTEDAVSAKIHKGANLVHVQACLGVPHPWRPALTPLEK